MKVFVYDMTKRGQKRIESQPREPVVPQRLGGTPEVILWEIGMLDLFGMSPSLNYTSRSEPIME